MNRRVLVLNGPNLNLLGVREPEIYGPDSLSDIRSACQAEAKSFDLVVDFRQSNHEGELIEWIQEARDNASAIVINPAGLSFTSIALLDALSMFDGPIIEVHISNIHRRESFRHHSYVSSVADGVICGCRTQGYQFAIARVAKLLGSPS
ncbi:MAG TPA: type II 3-dehydroquinate dehydratase [Alphaproteobacteria bacterium]|nr:type II 3-dehydroquinate dehydratase [Alphaproteobacteria bacterium]